MRTLFTSIILLLAVISCKKEPKEPEISTPSWLQGTWMHESSGATYNITSNNVIRGTANYGSKDYLVKDQWQNDGQYVLQVEAELTGGEFRIVFDAIDSDNMHTTTYDIGNNTPQDSRDWVRQ